MAVRETDERYMRIALEEAEQACRKGEVPVGAILVKDDQVLARDHNRCIELSDPTAHAEILVLRKAGEALGNYRLNGSALYVTTEPCPMCAFAMVHGRVARLVFGAREPKFGAVESRFDLLKSDGLNHRIEIEGGILGEECGEALKNFFARKRLEKKNLTHEHSAAYPQSKDTVSLTEFAEAQRREEVFFMENQREADSP